MGWANPDNMINNITRNNQFRRVQFTKGSGATALTLGRWYDMTYFNGTPAAHVHGNYVRNGLLPTATEWTFNSWGVYWQQVATGGVKHVNGSGLTDTMTQNTACVNGVSYSVQYTISGYGGSNSCTVSLGGTSGIARSANGTYRENITCGATANAPLTFSCNTAVAVTLTAISINLVQGFYPYTANDFCSLYTGANVAPMTKHVVNSGYVGSVATTATSMLMLVDLVGVYSRINLTAYTAQTLTNSLSQTRYPNGVGVQMFLSVSEVPNTYDQTIAVTYTNSAGVPGRTLGLPVTTTPSAIVGHIPYTCTSNAYGYGPFLPLRAGDTGVSSVQSITLNSGGGAMTTAIANLVLCKPIAYLPLTYYGYPAERACIQYIPSLPRIPDNACLNFLYNPGAATVAVSQLHGYLDVAWGNS